VGALWTPGYWGFYSSRYWFHPGHWGLHIGYYGGINYGFGYIGTGYEGGYWNSGHFTYNRVYTQVNERKVRNVYSYNAGNRGMNNQGSFNRGNNNNARPSFRGGQGGVQARPQASDAAAWREPTAPRMNTQVQHAQKFQSNPGQLANTNHGRPAQTAISKPIPADRSVKAPTQSRSRGAQQDNRR